MASFSYSSLFPSLRIQFGLSPVGNIGSGEVHVTAARKDEVTEGFLFTVPS